METYNLLKLNKENGIKLLFEQYAQKLLTYASYKWKLEQDTTWDLIYKTIYKTAEVINQYEFQNEQKFSSFIFKIFINHIRDHLRQSKINFQDHERVELSDRVVNKFHNDSTDKNVISNPKLKILEAELNKLEDWQRILLLLRSQNMSYDEISKYVDKPEKHLKVYYARLKKQLMDKMSQQLSINHKKENV